MENSESLRIPVRWIMFRVIGYAILPMGVLDLYLGFTMSPGAPSAGVDPQTRLWLIRGLGILLISSGLLLVGYQSFLLIRKGDDKVFRHKGVFFTIVKSTYELDRTKWISITQETRSGLGSPYELTVYPVWLPGTRKRILIDRAPTSEMAWILASRAGDHLQLEVRDETQLPVISRMPGSDERRQLDI